MARKIIIVGNGRIEDGLARFIDAADMVMRFNDCRSIGPGGGRTDIVAVCNTGRPGKAMTEGESWTGNHAVRLARSIWCVRDPDKFRAMEPDILRAHPELDDFCDDYTHGFAAFARDHAKQFHVIPGATHDALDRELAAHAPAPHVVPSTGLVAIAEFLNHFRQPSDRIFITGFSHQGWDGHPWQAEEAWMDDVMDRGELIRLTPEMTRRHAEGD
jgi:hypothetical protein